MKRSAETKKKEENSIEDETDWIILVNDVEYPV